VKRRLSTWILPCTLLIALLFGGLALNAGAVSEEEMPDFSSFNLLIPHAQWSFIDRAHNITDFGELLNLYMEWQLKGMQVCPCYCSGSVGLSEVYTMWRPIFDQQHSTRQAYLNDFDYLVQALGIEHYLFDKVFATRWLIENFFYMNDLIFMTFVKEGVTSPAIDILGLNRIDAMPLYAMLNWDFSGYEDGDEIVDFILEMMEIRPLRYRFALPETGFVVMFCG
jgi:hypothetical protein